MGVSGQAAQARAYRKRNVIIYAIRELAGLVIVASKFWLVAAYTALAHVHF
jgi:hypothetical protein